MNLLDRVNDELDRLRLGPGPWLLAVSGGADSMVLLDLVVRARGTATDLIVAHVDHGIHPDSARVAELVARRAAELGVPCVVTRLGLGPNTSETRARLARHGALAALRRESGARWILTAHHADDQRETVLMRLLRGSGPAGLAGMPRKGRGLARPLLAVSGADLRRYAADRGLAWWEDPANRDPQHLRSWLRGSLLPGLTDRLPDLGARLDAAGRHAARDRRAWTESLSHWPGLAYQREEGRHSISWGVLDGLPEALRLALAQALVRRAGGPAGARAVRRALHALARGASGMSADLSRGWRLELAFDRLAVIGNPAVSPAPARIDVALGELPWGPWTIRWRPDAAPGQQQRDGRTAWFIPGTLVVRQWRAGDRVAPLGGTGHRLAARCFQDARVAASERSAWPVVAIPEEPALAWIPGVCRSALRVPAAGEPAIRVELLGHG